MGGIWNCYYFRISNILRNSKLNSWLQILFLMDHWISFKLLTLIKQSHFCILDASTCLGERMVVQDTTVFNQDFCRRGFHGHLLLPMVINWDSYIFSTSLSCAIWSSTTREILWSPTFLMWNPKNLSSFPLHVLCELNKEISALVESSIDSLVPEMIKSSTKFAVMKKIRPSHPFIGNVVDLLHIDQFVLNIDQWSAACNQWWPATTVP